jgi:hypothetical protein
VDTMDIITGRKGKYFNILEKYHIYEISRKSLYMNDTNIDTHIPRFEELHKITVLPPPSNSPSKTHYIQVRKQEHHIYTREDCEDTTCC